MSTSAAKRLKTGLLVSALFLLSLIPARAGDTTGHTADAEQQTVDALYRIQHSDSLTRAGAWPRLIALSADTPSPLIVRYLSDPESPLYSPPLLDEYLTAAIAATDPAPDADGNTPPPSPAHLRARRLLHDIRLNAPGTLIADLRLLTPDATPVTLHTILGIDEAPDNPADASGKLVLWRSLGCASPAEESLILFYDPGCDACDGAIAELSSSAPPGVRIIAISVTDTLRPLPDTWFNLRVADTDALHDAYYIPSLPALYRLSPTARVISRYP